MVEFEASEVESNLSVQLASLTTYCMSMAGSYKNDVKMAQEAMIKLGKQNKELQEEIKKLKELIPKKPEMPVEVRRFDPKNAQEPTVQPPHPQNR